MSVLDIIQYDAKSAELHFERYSGKSRVLCKCKSCADKCDNAPVYERSLYYTKQQCARHMVDERGPATASSPPSFYKPEEVLSEMQAALCIPEEVCAAIRRGVSVSKCQLCKSI